MYNDYMEMRKHTPEISLRDFPNLEAAFSIASHITKIEELGENKNLSPDARYRQVAEQVALIGPLPTKAIQTFLPFARLTVIKLEEDKAAGTKIDEEELNELRAFTTAFEAVRTDFGVIDKEKTAEVIRQNPAVQEGLLRIDQDALVGHASVSEIYEASSPLVPDKHLVAKVQKPGAKEKYQETFALLKYLLNADIGNQTEKERKRNEITTLLLDVAASGYESEFNFEKEREALEKLRKIGIRTPTTYRELSNDTILVMDKVVNAVPLLHAARTKDVKTRKKIGERYVGSIVDMLVHGKLHGDPHGGNVLVDEKNQLHWIDPSPLIEFSRGEITQTLKLIYHMTKGNKTGVIDALNKLSENPLDKATIATLKTSTAEMNNINFALTIFREGLTPPDKYITISRALAEAMGTIVETHPERKGLSSWSWLLARKTIRSFAPF